MGPEAPGKPLTERELIDTGRPVTVEASEPSGEVFVFEGIVERARGEGVSLSLGRSGTSLKSLAPGTRVRVRYCNQEGMHSFQTLVLQAREGDRIRLLLEAPAEIARVQRRRFLRLEVRLPILCQRLDERGRVRHEAQALTLEVGGNGIGFLAEEKYAVGERLRVEFELERWGHCAASGVVRRSSVVPRPRGELHQLAVQFTEIDGKSQALILSYLVALQRARRKAS